MIDTIMLTPYEMARYIAATVQTKRLSLNMSQKTLSARSGVSLSVVKKFECTGKISLESLLKLALALDCLAAFRDLFQIATVEQLSSLDELLKSKTRKRGRQ